MNNIPNAHKYATVILIAVAFLFSQQVSGQTAIGAYAAYLVSTNTPASNNPPSRYSFGGTALWQTKKGVELRVGLGYRMESGSISTAYDSTLTSTQTAIIAVVDPNLGTGPTVESNIDLGTVELTATMGIPLAQIDSVGGGVLFLLGAGVDNILSAQQTDNYSAVPNYKGAKLQEYSFNSQIGFLAQVGFGVSLPLGGSKLLFDVTYTFRQPATIEYSNPVAGGPKEQDISWLAGRGLRLQVGYVFGL